jgi:hypothetical protein
MLEFPRGQLVEFQLVVVELLMAPATLLLPSLNATCICLGFPALVPVARRHRLVSR